MKILTTKRLATLLAVVLAFTFAFSDYTVAKAEAEDTTKEIVQYEEDGWIISKYVDTSGYPQFDVTYKGQTVEELKENGYEVHYGVISLMDFEDIGIRARAVYEGIFHGSINSDYYDMFTENKNTTYVMFSLRKSEQFILSDAITYYDDNVSTYILSSSCGYMVDYDIMGGKPSSFRITLKYSNRLTQIGEISISGKESTGKIPSNSISATNIEFENVEEEKTVDGKLYKRNYSLVSFDLKTADTYPTTHDPGSTALVLYNFIINGLVDADTNEPVDPFVFVTKIPSALETVVPVRSIKLTAASSSVYAGKSVKVTASVNSDATNKAVTWSSSNKNWATVDSNGNVTTTAAGAGKTVTITATAQDGYGVKSSYTLKIDKVLTRWVKLASPVSHLAVGKAVKLTASVNSDATNKAVTWSSSNKNWATVDSSGKVTAKAAGAGHNVSITAKAKDGSNFKASYKLKIEKTPVKCIIITSSPSNYIAAGKATKLTAKVNKGGYTTVSWKSSNTNYATVDKNGKVTTKSAGAGKTVTITATAADGSNTKKAYNIKVGKTAVRWVKISGSTSVNYGKSITLKASVNSDASNKALSWSVSSNEYAKISSSGKLTPSKKGKGHSIYVYAKAKDGSGKSQRIKVKIN